MINLSDLNLRALVNTYVVANTPGYLYRHFRREASVHDVAEKYSASDLVSTIGAIDALPERSPHDAATAYAALVALSFHPPEILQEVLPRLGRVRNLEWIDPILDMIRSQPAITHSTGVARQIRMTTADESRTPAITTTARLVATQKS